MKSFKQSRLVHSLINSQISFPNKEKVSKHGCISPRNDPSAFIYTDLRKANCMVGLQFNTVRVSFVLTHVVERS